MLAVAAVGAACGSGDETSDPALPTTGENADIANDTTSAVSSEPPATTQDRQPTSTVIDGGDDVGMVETEEQAEAQARIGSRADVAVDAELENSVLSIDVFGVDVAQLFGPSVDVTLTDFRIAELPPDCVPTETGFTCTLAGSVAPAQSTPPPTEAVTWMIQLIAAPEASSSSVDIVATSRDNPLDNDPDPTNNAITLTTGR